ncbi:galanin receptor type 1-like [Engraulis encrasicolus]|uniref:galanin receptor type 1-like n=1 Tax=Engraulis encrasicolus TaxID=184585 RepID=UPI002FD005AB
MGEDAPAVGNGSNFRDDYPPPPPAGTTGSATMTRPSDWDMQQLLVPTMDALIMLTGTIGHSLVIFVLAGRRKRRSRAGPPHGTDTLLLALSASDLLLLLCLPFHTTAIALGTWPFGNFLCKAISFLGVACNASSVFTLSALAVSRYLTVVHPAWAFGRRRVGHWLNAVVVLQWLPACALAAPQFFFRGEVASSDGSVSSSPVGPVHCFTFLSNLSTLVYSTALFLVGFAIPLAVIVLMYTKIYCFLRHTRRQGRAPQLERYQSQVTQTSALLVVVFTLCWLPSYVLMFMLVGDSQGGGGDTGGTGGASISLGNSTTSSSEAAAAAASHRSFAIFARLLASSSTVANPVLYVFMSHKFRQELLGLSRHRCRSRCRGDGDDDNGDGDCGNNGRPSWFSCRTACRTSCGGASCCGCWRYCPIPGRDTVRPFNPMQVETPPPPHG